MLLANRAPSYRAVVRGARVKWWIFGVMLPLLPIGARIAAAWIDEAGTLGFVDLFSDGELLVLATVVAAAGIGDLVFDLRGDRRRDSRERLRIAMVHALALIVVVGSVLFFGLVTYSNQTRADALERAQAAQVTGQLEAQDATREARRLEFRKLQLQDRLRRTRVLLAREVAGRGPNGVRGTGIFALQLRREAVALRQEIERLDSFIHGLRSGAASQRQTGVSLLTTTSADVNRGREQAAVISVVMFLLSLAAAFPAVGLAASDRAEADVAPSAAGHV